jgi:hypothetical protein
MTDTPEKAPRTVRPLTYVALGVSVLTSASLWYASAGTWPSPEFVFESIGWLLLIGVTGFPAGVVLDILAGKRGGVNRIISIAAGVILISPAIYIAIGIIQGLLILKSQG